MLGNSLAGYVLGDSGRKFVVMIAMDNMPFDSFEQFLDGHPRTRPRRSPRCKQRFDIHQVSSAPLQLPHWSVCGEASGRQLFRRRPPPAFHDIETRDLHLYDVSRAGSDFKQRSHRSSGWQCAYTELLGPTTYKASRDDPREVVDRQHSDSGVPQWNT